MAVSMQHHPHQQQQGPSPHIPQHSRPSSIVQQHLPHAAPQQNQQAQQQQQPYPYHQQHAQHQHTQQSQAATTHSNQEIPYYAAAAPQQSPYSTPGATSGYTSADTSDMMAAAMPRPPYPPMSYHTPQSNSPASVASPSGHDQQRSLYGQTPPQLHQQSMYYGQPQYSSMSAQQAPSPYSQHPQQTHQPMTSQPGMMMQHNSAAQHHMSQHPHAQATQQHAQAGMTGSPRHPKIEPLTMQRPGPPASMGPPAMSQSPMAPSQMTPSQMSTPQMGQTPQMAQTPQMGQSQTTPNGAPMTTPTGAPGSGGPGGAANINSNAAPGPIPATTPLVVRQDQNGVQWIAFEYSRDRVKMEYTIRCDVESVNTDELDPTFKQDNCVYPRACVPKEQYRGNRLQYETECNTVGWALAELNAPLRGKRGLIQRAVDSWRNSNRDPRLRSRRVRRMAKITTRKVNAPPGSAGSGGGAPHGMPGAPVGGGPMSGGPGGMVGKGPGGMMGGGPGGMHHHAGDGSGQGNGEEVDDDSFSDDAHHHHHHQAPAAAGSSSAPAADDVRQSQVFNSGYGPYGSNNPSSSSIHDGGMHHQHHPGAGHHAIAASSSAAAGGGPSGGSGGVGGRRHSRATAAAAAAAAAEDPADLFPDIPDAKKRKFILVEDSDRQSRLRVRVTLDGVDTREIPDSFRKSSAVYPRSYFPREMQSPPPSATGSKFFMDDLADDDGGLMNNNNNNEDDRDTDTEGRRAGRGRRNANSLGKRVAQDEVVMVSVPMADGSEGQVAVPKMRRGARGKEVRLNDLGFRMAWLQSRVFAGRTIFLQRALDCYRNKTRSAIESLDGDVKTVAPHFETRVGKRKWNEHMRRNEKKADDA